MKYLSPFSGFIFIAVSLKFGKVDRIFKMCLIFIGQSPKKKGGGEQKQNTSDMCFREMQKDEEKLQRQRQTDRRMSRMKQRRESGA